MIHSQLQVLFTPLQLVDLITAIASSAAGAASADITTVDNAIKDSNKQNCKHWCSY